MAAYRLLLVSDQSPKSVCDLAIRIESKVPNTKIGGIVLQVTSLRKRWFPSTIKRFVNAIYFLVHAFPAKWSASVDFTADDLARECRRLEIPLLIVNSFSGPDITNVVNASRSDLGILVGLRTIDPSTFTRPKDGFVHVWSETDSLVEAGTSRCSSEACVRLKSAPDPTAASREVSVQLPIQDYDTPKSVALKTELISNDLVVQMVNSYSRGRIAHAAEEANRWAEQMLPGYFSPSSDFRSLSKSLMWRTRPTWKLVFHTLVLFSPYVIIRNWSRRWRKKFPVVIFYHHLISDRPHRLGMPTELFLREALFLKKFYNVVTLSQAIEMLQSGSVEAPTVALTFDDGYEDNFVNLRAVAEATNLPVTLFVCSQVVEGRGELQHDITNGQRNCKSLGWEQLRYWQSDTTEVGSHTQTHFDCGSSDRPSLEKEIVGSRDDIEHSLGEPVRFFAFPWGQIHNISAGALEIATSTYRCCFSTEPAENVPRSGVVLEVVGRKALPSTPWELELTLQSILDWTMRFKFRRKHLKNKTYSTHEEHQSIPLRHEAS